MTLTEIAIPTRDGQCPTQVFTPSGLGPWPAVIVFADAFGVRPAMSSVAERICKEGYVVLLPNLFYRLGPFEAPDVKAVSSDQALRQAWFAKYLGAVSHPTMRDDTESLLQYTGTGADVMQRKIGVVGYCMGGGFAIAAAGNFPEQIAAVASYHGGRLATDKPESPHRHASTIKARVYVGAAVDDDSFPDDMKERLEKALSEARVNHTIETYAGCRHGWTLSDTPAFNPAGAEKHYETMLSLFATALK